MVEYLLRMLKALGLISTSPPWKEKGKKRTSYIANVRNGEIYKKFKLYIDNQQECLACEIKQKVYAISDIPEALENQDFLVEEKTYIPEYLKKNSVCVCKYMYANTLECWIWTESVNMNSYFVWMCAVLFI